MAYTLSLESTAQSKIVATFTDPDGKIFHRATLSNDGSMIAASTNEKTIVWDFKTEEIINTYDGIVQSVGLDFSPDGRYLVSGGLSLKADVWDIKTGEAILKIQQKTNDYNYSDPLGLVKFTSDGKYLLAWGSADFEMWDVESKLIQRVLTKLIPVAGNYFYPQNNPALLFFNEYIREQDTTTGEYHSAYTLSIYNIETGKRERIIAKHAILKCVSQNKRYLVYHDETISNQNEYDLVVYNLEKDIELFRITKSNVSSELICAISNFGDFYIYNNPSDNEDKEYVHFFNIADKRIMHTIKTNPEIFPTVFGDFILFPDDTKLLVRKPNQIIVYDVSDLTSGVKNVETLGR